MRIHGRRVAAAGVALVTAMTGAVMVASPASASSDQCPDGYVCFWERNAYGGDWYFSTYSQIDNVGNDFNDKMTSVWNRTSCIVVVYQNANESGNTFWIYPYGSASAVDSYFNDEMTSYRQFCT
jgi:Peptidase inhibitor family I36